MHPMGITPVGCKRAALHPHLAPFGTRRARMEHGPKASGTGPQGSTGTTGILMSPGPAAPGWKAPLLELGCPVGRGWGRRGRTLRCPRLHPDTALRGGRRKEQGRKGLLKLRGNRKETVNSNYGVRPSRWG